MPSVKLTPETFEKLKAYAASKGCTPDAAAEAVLGKNLPAERPAEDDWPARFDAIRARIQARIPPEVTEEEIEADIRAAIEEVREERRARSR